MTKKLRTTNALQQLYALIFSVLIILPFCMSGCSPGPTERDSIKNKADSLDNQLLKFRHEFDSDVDPGQLLVALKSVADSTGDVSVKMTAEYWDILLNAPYMTLDSIGHRIISAKTLIDSIDDQRSWYRFVLLDGTLELQRGHLLEAYKKFKQLEQYYSSISDTVSLANTYRNIASVYTELSENTSAYTFYKKADSLYSIAGTEKPRIYNLLSIANNLNFRGELSRSYALLDSLTAYGKLHDDIRLIINCRISRYGFNPEKRGQRWLDYADSTFQIAMRHGLKEESVNSCINLANAHSLQGNDQGTVSASSLAMKLGRDYGYENITGDVLPLIIDVFEKRNMPDSANLYRKLYIGHLENKVAEEAALKIHDIETLSAINVYEKELEYERQNAVRGKIIVIAIATFTLMLLAMAAVIYYSRNKRNELKLRIKKSENERLKIEQDKLKIEQDKLKIEMAAKDRELSATEMRLGLKKELIEEIVKYKDSLSTDQIINRLKSQLVAENEWTRFNVYFNNVYPDFFVKLKSRYPILSEGDLKHCAMIIIGLSIKQIAQMLGIENRSVQMIRYRLRKKLNLEPTDDLNHFIRSIVNE